MLPVMHDTADQLARLEALIPVLHAQYGDAWLGAFAGEAECLQENSAVGEALQALVDRHPCPDAGDLAGQARCVRAWAAAYPLEGRTLREFWADLEALPLPLVAGRDDCEEWYELLAHLDIAGFTGPDGGEAAPPAR